jgi:hypothetical protein
MIPISRGRFIKGAIQFGSSLVLLSLSIPTRLNAKGNSKNPDAKKEIPLPEGESPVKESDPTAKALGFHHDARKTDFTLYPDRKSPLQKNHICLNCAQYNPRNQGWGKCNILTNGLVSSLGWCSAWGERDNQLDPE